MNGIGPISPRRGSHAMTALAIAAMVAALFGAENASASDAGPIDPAAIDAFVEHQLARQLVPGAAIAITRGDRVVHGRGYGEAAEGVPATVGTRFAIASLSKGITAVAVMQLVERGAVDLDAPVIRYLPDFTVADARTARITVRHLLNHTSGLADAGFPHMTLPQPRSIAERVASLRSARLVAEPGTQFHYFDPNYAILARLVEVVGGEPFGAYLARNVFEPLGMESTVSLVHSAELESAPGLAQGHIGLFGVAVPRDEAQGYLAGSTGVISTAADMARYLAFQAGAHPAGDSVLSGAALRELQSPPGRPDSTYAMGWIRDDHPQLGPILHHNGVLGTFHADAVLVPDQQIGIVLLVNSSHALAAYDVTWRGVLALIGGRSPIDGPIDAREIELAFAALTVLTVGLRLRNLVRARGRTRGPLASLGGAFRLARAVVPGVAFLALPQVVSATSGRVFPLGQIAAAMPGASVFLLANAVIGLAGVAISLSATRHRGSPVKAMVSAPASRAAKGARRLRALAGAAGTWSLAYGALAVSWAMGGSGFPFGLAADPGASLSALAGATQATTAPAMAVLAGLGVPVAGAMGVGVRHGVARRVLLAFAWSAAALLAIAIPDPRWLAVLAYAPIMAVGGLFGWSPEQGLLEVITWPMIHQLVCIGGGILWAAAALGYARATDERCVACGRSDERPDVPRWARARAAWRAVAVAAAVPILYGITRWAWALGVPLGVDAMQLQQVHADGFPVAPAGLGTMAFGAAALTLGLVQRWGAVFPSWVPWLSGRRVPPALAVAPATLVAVLVVATGLVFVRFTLADLDQLLLAEGWAVYAPGLLWPVWGVALAYAALAYHYRHRGRCAACGRGRSRSVAPPRVTAGPRRQLAER